MQGAAALRSRQHATKSMESRIFAKLRRKPAIFTAIAVHLAAIPVLPGNCRPRRLIKSTAFGKMVFFALQQTALLDWKLFCDRF